MKARDATPGEIIELLKRSPMDLVMHVAMHILQLSVEVPGLTPTEPRLRIGIKGLPSSIVVPSASGDPITIHLEAIESQDFTPL